MNGVIAYLSIGDFSRATHLTVKTLHHYHQIGLLVPAQVDPHTGYRRYTTEQFPTAQIIRRTGRRAASSPTSCSPSIVDMSPSSCRAPAPSGPPGGSRGR